MFMMRSSWKDGVIITVTFGTVLTLFAAVLAATVFGEAIWWSDRLVASSCRNGDRVIAALERYHKEHDAYPAELDRIRPGYLPTIPRPTAGDRRWRYEVSEDGKSFVLAFAYDERDYPISWFYSRDESRHKALGWAHDA